MGRTSFTNEANDFLRENWQNYSSRELSEQLRILFDIHVATQTVTDQLNRLGIHRGRYFLPKDHYTGGVKPIGYETIVKGRTVMVKVAQPNVWKPKAQVLMNYDPTTHQVIFLDGNSLNVTKENILIVSKRIHARLAKNGWLDSSNDVLMAGIKWSELYYAIKEMTDEEDSK